MLTCPVEPSKIIEMRCKLFKLVLSFHAVFTFQEAYIAELDAKSGASLKLTILNPKGRIWTMVAGGGASVVYR